MCAYESALMLTVVQVVHSMAIPCVGSWVIIIRGEVCLPQGEYVCTCACAHGTFVPTSTLQDVLGSDTQYWFVCRHPHMLRIPAQRSCLRGVWLCGVPLPQHSVWRAAAVIVLPTQCFLLPVCKELAGGAITVITDTTPRRRTQGFVSAEVLTMCIYVCTGWLTSKC